MIVDWKVQVERIAGDADLLRDVLSHFGYSLTPSAEMVNDSWTLTHPKYQGLGSAEEVRDDAESMAQRIKRLSELEDILVGFEIGPIIQSNDDGSTNKTIFVTMRAELRASGHMSGTVTRNPEITQEEHNRRMREAEVREAARKRAETISRMKLTLQDANVLQVRQILKTTNPSGTELGHIIDLVKNACGGNINRYCTRQDETRFYRSINHPEIMGRNARHILTNAQPPPNPMGLKEAQTFARQVALAWLEDEQ